MIFCWSCQQTTGPDLILYNAQVITVDSDFTITKAIAISGDSIVAVGDNEEIKNLAGANTELIDQRVGKNLIK